jgi:hypothetical protein
MGIIWGRTSCVSDIYMSTLEVLWECTTIFVWSRLRRQWSLAIGFPNTVCDPKFFNKIASLGEIVINVWFGSRFLSAY